jgi:hypothetical protein
LRDKIRIKQTIKFENYLISLAKRKAKLTLLVKKHLADSESDIQQIEEVLIDLSVTDSLIETINNNFTFYKNKENK